MKMKTKMWFCSISGCFFATQAVGCFYQRHALVNMPGRFFMNFVYGTASLIFCCLYFTAAFRTYKTRRIVQATFPDDVSDLLNRPTGKRLSQAGC
jgi:hypothetical protein